jgi:chemotaxis protein MotB
MLAIFAFLVGCVSEEELRALQEENARLTARVARLDAIVEKERETVRQLREDLKPLTDRGIVTIEVKEGRVLLGMKSDVLFAKGSADLSADGKDAVQQLARALSRRAADRDYQVEGHTDSDPINTPAFPNNWYLGAARGIVVTEAMIAAGMPRQHVSAASFADTHPVDSNNSAAGQALNRRIDVVLVPDVSDVYKRLEKPGPGEPKKGKGKGKNREES